MTWRNRSLHLLFCQFPCEMHAVFQLPLPDQIPEILSVGGDLQLLLQRVVCRQVISRHIHLHIGEFPADPWAMLSGDNASPSGDNLLTDEDAVGFTVLRVPAAFIEGSAQGLIHRIILCSGIPPGGHLPVPCCPAGDISRQTDGFSPSHLCGRISPAGCAGCPVSPDPGRSLCASRAPGDRRNRLPHRGCRCPGSPTGSSPDADRHGRPPAYGDIPYQSSGSHPGHNLP